MKNSDTCISIFGLGYVGCVTAACFACQGYRVIGIDIDQEKVNAINSGKSPIIEKSLEKYIKNGIRAGKLRATVSSEEAIKCSNFIMVCVGTPTNNDGSLNLKFIERVSEEIGFNLRNKKDYSVIIYRSSIIPGTMESKIIPILKEKSGKKNGMDFGVCFNPEFLREGVAIDDFFNPPKIVIGEEEKGVGDLIMNLYKNINAPVIRTNLKTSEMIKYVDNVFHALKITFANEIGILCKSLNIESHDVMKNFCKDHKLNLSSYYLKPGFAFGGSCLPKDLRALLFAAKELKVELPVLSSILLSNEMQIKLLFQRISKFGKKKIGILGLSFKEGTDDLRESSLVKLTGMLLKKEYLIKIYDKNVFSSRLVGTNKEYVLKYIPCIFSIIVNSLEEIINFAEVIIIPHKTEEIYTILDKFKDSQIIIDMIHIMDSRETKAHYEGLYW